MSILRKAGTVAAISVAGAGIAVGGIGFASADDSTSGQDSTSQTSSPAGESRGHGHERGGRGGSGQLVPGLAEALGLEESDVSAALEAVHGQLEPEARQAGLASALAAELGVSEQQVSDAFDSLRIDRMAQGRTSLADRLDAAVANGSLTEADSQAVLKAFDAGVLGGERR